MDGIDYLDGKKVVGEAECSGGQCECISILMVLRLGEGGRAKGGDMP